MDMRCVAAEADGGVLGVVRGRVEPADAPGKVTLRAGRVRQRMFHAVEVVLEVSGRVVHDVHPGEKENARPSGDAFPDMTGDARESFAVPPVVAGEIERDRGGLVAEPGELLLVEVALDAEGIAGYHGIRGAVDRIREDGVHGEPGRQEEQ